MPRIAHIVNILEIREVHRRNYLHIAQPVTLKSMLTARQASPDLDVELVCIKHRDEDVSVPDGFVQASDLDKYCYDYLPDLPRTRDLPILADIINGLYETSTAEYFIFTNVDIGVCRRFYQIVAQRIASGSDAFTIDRRDLPKEVGGVVLDENTMDLIYRQRGVRHPGTDCFVFRRDIVPDLDLGLVFVGYPPIGGHLRNAILKNARSFRRFRNGKWFWPRLPVTFHLGSDRAFRDTTDIYYQVNRREAHLSPP